MIDNKQVKGKNSLKIDQIESYLLDNYEIRVNVVNNSIEKRPKGSIEPFEQINEQQLKYELFKAGYSRFDGELRALLGSSIMTKYDPFKEYFEGLPEWDKQIDYIQELSKYVRTDNQKWFELMFRKMLVRIVAQSFGTERFNKHCFTFVGNQHDGKTSFFDFLVPPLLKSYYKKGYDFHGGKEGKFSLVQNFLINLDELAQFEKKDLNNEFKATLSENYVRYRPLHSNSEASFPRRASFVASTNQFEFLTDATGSVRWIIFCVLEILHDNGGEKGYSQNIDIDKVWAQAYHLFKEGYTGELDRNEISQNEILNRSFVRITAEMELILKYFDRGEKSNVDSEFYTATDIEKFLKDSGHTKVNSTSIGNALKMLNFQQSSKYDSKSKMSVKGYFLLPKSFLAYSPTRNNIYN